MKKFIIFLFSFMIVLTTLAYSNQNPDVIIQQRNIEFMNMMGQIELDKRREEEARRNSQPASPPLDLGYEQFLIVLWNNETGHYTYSYEWTKESRRSATKNLKKRSEKQFGVKYNKDKYWDEIVPVLVMGLDRKTQKWVLFGDNDFAKWINYVYNELKDSEGNFIKYIEADLLNKCNATADHCQVILTYPLREYLPD